MSQGAAQAIEDAAALGMCLSYVSDAKDIPKIAKAYETLRMERAYAVQARSTLNGKIWHCECAMLSEKYATDLVLMGSQNLSSDPDGEDQQRRDDGMAATLTGEHYVRSTNQWSDPPTQIWLYNHDAEAVASRYMEDVVGYKKKNSGKVSAGLSPEEELIEAGLLPRLAL